MSGGDASLRSNLSRDIMHFDVCFFRISCLLFIFILSFIFLKLGRDNLSREIGRVEIGRGGPGRSSDGAVIYNNNNDNNNDTATATATAITTTTNNNNNNNDNNNATNSCY